MSTYGADCGCVCGRRCIASRMPDFLELMLIELLESIERINLSGN